MIMINTILHISQPQISGKKLKKIEEGPQASQRDLLNLAFMVYNNWEELEKQEKALVDKNKYQMFADALYGSRWGPKPEGPTNKPPAWVLPGTCFKCNQT